MTGKSEESLPSDLKAPLLRNLLGTDPDRAISALKKMIGQPDEHGTVRSVLAGADLFSSRSLFETFLRSIAADIWDAGFTVVNVFKVPSQNRTWVIELLEVSIRRNLERVLEDVELQDLEWRETRKITDRMFNNVPVTWDVTTEVAAEEPETSVSALLPLLADMVVAFSPDQEECRMWLTLPAGPRTVNPSEVFLQLVLDAVRDFSGELRQTAAEPLDTLKQVGNGISRLIRHRILSAGSPDMVREAVGELRDLMQANESLHLQDGYITTGLVLQSAYQALESNEWEELLEDLLGFYPAAEKERIRGRGSRLGMTQHRLLASLPSESLTGPARRRLLELQRRFHDSTATLHTTSFSGGGRVNSVDDVELGQMNDDAVMSYARFAKPSSDDFLHEPDVNATLEYWAKQQPERFAQMMVERFDDTLPPDRFEAVLHGLSDAFQSDEHENPPWELAFEAIRKANEYAPAESARMISWVLRHHEGVPPLDIVDIVEQNLLEHEDPDEETWTQGYYDEDPYFAGINCVRGTMAERFGEWLLEDEEIFLERKETIVRAAADPSTQVRACAAFMVLASMNHNREFAIETFLELVKGQPEPLLGTVRVGQVLQYGIRTHWGELGSTVERMLVSSTADVRKAGGVALGLATFVDDDALGQAQEAIQNTSTDVAVVRGLAEVLTVNVEKLSDAQRKLLVELYDCSEESVSKQIATVFRHADDEFLIEHDDLVVKFLDSRVFKVAPAQLFFRLKDASHQLDTLALDACEKFVEVHCDEARDTRTHAAGSAHTVTRILTRIYGDSGADSDEATRVFELLDRMVRAGIWPAEQALDRL